MFVPTIILFSQRGLRDVLDGVCILKSMGYRRSRAGEYVSICAHTLCSKYDKKLTSMATSLQSRNRDRKCAKGIIGCVNNDRSPIPISVACSRRQVATFPGSKNSTVVHVPYLQEMGMQVSLY